MCGESYGSCSLGYCCSKSDNVCYASIHNNVHCLDDCDPVYGYCICKPNAAQSIFRQNCDGLYVYNQNSNSKLYNCKLKYIYITKIVYCIIQYKKSYNILIKYKYIFNKGNMNRENYSKSTTEIYNYSENDEQKSKDVPICDGK